MTSAQFFGQKDSSGAVLTKAPNWRGRKKELSLEADTKKKKMDVSVICIDKKLAQCYHSDASMEPRQVLQHLVSYFIACHTNIKKTKQEKKSCDVLNTQCSNINCAMAMVNVIKRQSTTGHIVDTLPHAS